MNISNNRGQILVEYMLLLLIAVAAATILTSQLVGKRTSEEDSGILIKSWNKIIRSIGNDLPDCPKQQNYNNPNCP